MSMFTNIEHDKKLNKQTFMRTFDLEILSPEDDALIRACARVLERIPEAKVTVRRSRARANHADRESDAILIVNERKFETPYNIDCKKHIAAVVDVTLRKVRASAKRHGTRPMVMVPYVNTTLGERLRLENVDYVDAVGNAFIQAPPLFVDWSGRKPLEKEAKAGRLFSGASSLQLVALLLSVGESITWSYRDLALGAGISLGSASLLMGEMRREGYLRRQSERLENAADLLERWMQGYHRRLRPKLFQKKYRTTEGRGVEDLVPLLGKMPEVLIGGELAGALRTKMLRPTEATLHVPREMDSRRLMSGLRLLPDAAGNVEVLSQFGKGEVWQRRGSSGVSLAAPLLVYAELMKASDDRVRATARAVYDLEIAPHAAELSNT
jgi:hypothetical protein